MLQQIWWRSLQMYFAYMNYLLLFSKMLVLSVLALLSLIPGCWTTCRTTSSSAAAIAVSSPSATRSAASSPGTTRSSMSGSKSPAICFLMNFLSSSMWLDLTTTFRFTLVFFSNSTSSLYSSCATTCSHLNRWEFFKPTYSHLNRCLSQICSSKKSKWSSILVV